MSTDTMLLPFYGGNETVSFPKLAGHFTVRRVYMRPQVVAIVPAFNEAETIAATVAALRAQTYPIDRIIVVPNNCSDASAEVARGLGVEVWDMGLCLEKKAQALNQALALVLSSLSGNDRVLVTDGDSILDPASVAEAVTALNRPIAGAACANFLGDETVGLLPQLQRNEYSRFARQVRRGGDRARVLSGVATMFRVDALHEILRARQDGRLPAAVGVYHYGCATEDIELTFAFRRLGYRPVAPRRFIATTDTMSTADALWKQRLRWQRGMLDALRLYRLRRDTVAEHLRQVAIYAGSLTVPLYLLFLAYVMFGLHTVPFDPRWLPLSAIFVAERVLTVRRDGWKAMALAALMVPEWCYEQFRSACYWHATWKTWRNAARVWVAT